MNRTPRGPNARGPDDLSSTLPCCSDFAVSAPAAVTAINPTAIPTRALLSCIGYAFPEGEGASFRGDLHQYAGAIGQSIMRCPSLDDPRPLGGFSTLKAAIQAVGTVTSRGESRLDPAPSGPRGLGLCVRLRS